MTVIAGIPIPSTSPWFLAGVGLHVAFGIAAVVLGAIAMLSRKGPGRHRRFGAAYVWALTGAVLTASGLAAVHWAEDWRLFVLGLVAFGAALLGRAARRRGGPGWARRHIIGMGASYVAMLTAFYVDNGKSLPIWRALPSLAYWTLPSLVGLPIILWAIARHPMAVTNRLRRNSPRPAPRP